MLKRKRGLQNVPPSDHRPAEAAQHPLAQRESRDDDALLVPLELIAADPEQPRRSLDEEALSELADSIKAHGVLQPLVLIGDTTGYRVVAGERRYRAAKLAGLTEVPARLYQGDRAREVQLVENLQREDLPLLEEARALAELRDHRGASIRELEQATGKSKSYIGRRLKVLDMPEDVQAMLEREPGLLSKAEALAKIEDPGRRKARIATLLSEPTSRMPEKPSPGRPVKPLTLKSRKDGSFDLVVKYRPGQVDRQELIAQLREMVRELEKEKK